jgi:sialate O-acetylesterase
MKLRLMEAFLVGTQSNFMEAALRLKRSLWSVAAAFTVLLAASPFLVRAQQQAPPAGPQLLHPMFQDHAVLQRDRPINIYGETAPGAAVTVTLGTGTTQARAGADGRWRAVLPAMPAGGPYTLVATAGSDTKSAGDVLIGDVFFCAGQSNVAFAQRQAQGAAEDAHAATDGTIRQLNISTTASLTPLQTFATPVRWVVGSPETVGNFSAACYYFARDLKKIVNVPVGMVVAAWGGARARNWVSEGELRRAGLDTDDLDMLALWRTDQQAALRRWGAKWENWWTSALPNAGRPWMPDYSDTSWKTAPAALGAWAMWNGTSPDGFVGQMWLRTTVTLTAEQAAKPGAVLDLGGVNEEDETWINGKDVGGSSFANRTQHAIRPGVLKDGVNVIATNIFCSWRNCGIRGPAENRAIRFADGTSVLLSNPWKYQEVADTRIAPQLPWGPTHGVMMDYNGMVSPIGPFGLRGVVWYQGESDIYFARDYKPALLALMRDWRRQFEHPDLPFLIVQLPNYGPASAQPAASVWADVREAQRQAVLEDKHAALTVNADIGDAANLHPTNKAELGRRLALAARNLVYGERIPPSGPEVASVKRLRSDVVVTFRDVSGALSQRAGQNQPSGFELCGASQASCRAADARVEGATVVLRDIGNATRVRYCWADTPVCSVSDDSHRPAGPFEAPIK